MTISIETLYVNVHSFEDLLKINIKFLNGIYLDSCYFSGPFDKETLPMLYSLKIMNRLGFYTVDSQAANQTIYVDSIYVKSSQNEKSYICCSQQRAYIEGLIDKVYVELLYLFLQSYNNEIYYIIQDEESNHFTNIPEYTKIILSREGYVEDNDIFYKDDMMDDYKLLCLFEEKVTDTDWVDGNTVVTVGEQRNNIISVHANYENIVSILTETSASLMIITKDFNSSFSLEKMMLDFFVNHT